MNNYDDIDIDELVKAVLSGKECSTLFEAPPVQKFVPEEEDAYELSRSFHFGIRKASFLNICLAGTT